MREQADSRADTIQQTGENRKKSKSSQQTETSKSKQQEFRSLEVRG
jgi:hypothetical protein